MRLLSVMGLPLAIVLCVAFISGLHSEEVDSSKATAVVLIDFVKYQQLLGAEKPFFSNETRSLVCADPENEEYRKCDSKCVSSCRSDPSISEMIISKDQCDKMKCVEGCFCKNDLVRYLGKCISAKNCRTRAGRAMNSYTNNPTPFWRMFPFFHRPNCGPKGCSVIEIHNHNEAISHGNDDDDDDDNRKPVVIHVHGSGSESNNDDNNNNNNNNNNNPINNIIIPYGGCGTNGCGSHHHHGGGYPSPGYPFPGFPYDGMGGNSFSATYYPNGSYSVSSNGRTYYYDSNGNLIGGGSGGGSSSYPQTSYNSQTGGTTVTYSSGNSITYYPDGSRSITSNGITYNYGSDGEIDSYSSSSSSSSGYPVTTYYPGSNTTSVAYSSSYAYTINPDGSYNIYYNGITYSYDSDGDLVSTTPGTDGLWIGGINAPGGGFSSPGSGFGGTGFGFPGFNTPFGSFGGSRLKPNIAVPNRQVPEIQPPKSDFPMPPKQVTVQVPDKRKVVKNQNQKENSNYVPNLSSQYVPQPNIGNMKVPSYAFVGAALTSPTSQSVHPLTLYPIPPTAFDSVQTMLSKPSKKKTADQSLQNSKKPPKEIPFISISVSPHQNIQNPNLQRDLHSTNIEGPSSPSYSPSQVPPVEQAAYFNYLNTYNPNFNNQNRFSPQNTHPIKPPKQFNPFTSPFSSKYPNGKPQQSHSELNAQQNIPNPFTNPNLSSPFSGVNPSFIGNLPPQFYGNTPNSVSNSSPSQYYNNDSEDFDEDALNPRKQRQP